MNEIMRSSVYGLLLSLFSSPLPMAQKEPVAYPTMAASNTWYKGATAKNTITEINFVKEYTVTGNETESWAADVDDSGSIMCYVNDTVLTICSMGAEKIMANEDSSQVFSGVAATTRFSAATAINGLEMLNTSNATDMTGMFMNCNSLSNIDVSHFDTSNVTAMSFMFGNCDTLTALDLSNFDTSNVTTMFRMFAASDGLTSLDLRNFDTRNATDMDRMFNKCPALAVVYVGSGWTTENAVATNMFEDCGISQVTYV